MEKVHLLSLTLLAVLIILPSSHFSEAKAIFTYAFDEENEIPSQDFDFDLQQNENDIIVESQVPQENSRKNIIGYIKSDNKSLTVASFYEDQSLIQVWTVFDYSEKDEWDNVVIFNYFDVENRLETLSWECTKAGRSLGASQECLMIKDIFFQAFSPLKTVAKNLTAVAVYDADNRNILGYVSIYLRDELLVKPSSSYPAPEGGETQQELEDSIGKDEMKQEIPEYPDDSYLTQNNKEPVPLLQDEMNPDDESIQDLTDDGSANGQEQIIWTDEEVADMAKWCNICVRMSLNAKFENEDEDKFFKNCVQHLGIRSFDKAVCSLTFDGLPAIKSQDF